MHDVLPKPEGLRERKRRQTLQRIAEVGLKLFLANGYEATTLDEIAQAAGTSRRTFFYYFKSKHEILVAQISGYADQVKAAVLEHSPAGMPLDVARDALLKVAARAQSPQMIAMSRLMKGNEALLPGKLARYERLEQALYEALHQLWRGQERRDGLRLVAMVAIGAVRVASEVWFQQDGKRPLTEYIQEAFENLRAEI